MLFWQLMDCCSAVFLEFSARKLTQFSGRIQDCLSRLTEDQIWSRGTENENAAGNLVLHLSGNVRQWVISAVGQAPDIRRRDEEFSARGGVPRAELAMLLRNTVAEAVSVIEALTADRLTERIVVQGYDITVLEAVYHVVEHFAGHTGQIIYATKLLTGKDTAFYQHLAKSAPHSEQTP
jgi:uncharacterized damage-inducible protein DinB